MLSCILYLFSTSNLTSCILILSLEELEGKFLLLILKYYQDIYLHRGNHKGDQLRWTFCQLVFEPVACHT